MKKLHTTSHPLIGADPEFFIASTKSGSIIESSKVIPKIGLKVTNNSKCTRDGVQAELNPIPHGCRQGAGADYIKMFKELSKIFSKKKAIMCLQSMVHLTPEQLDQLSDDAKKFGCKPSIDNYTSKESVIKVNPSIYGYRSGGGHIHLGAGINTRLGNCIRKKHRLLVKILDLVLGNTCVMLDRDQNQIERRKVYGRAGEYRLPAHGLEYRTLSNFWLKNYQLMAMVYGFARLALTITYNIYIDELDTKEKSIYRELLKISNEKDVQKAINNNNFDLARKNWNDIKDVLVSMIPDGAICHYPINKRHLKYFEHFIDKGLAYWFKDDMLTHWTKKAVSVYGAGWETFLSRVVKADMKHKGKITWTLNTTSGCRVHIIKPEDLLT